MTDRDLDASAASPPSAPAETVVRPEPGTLARGVWEAPAWAFYAAAALVVLAALLYAARSAGLFRRRRGA
jgi:hypothetical protein